MPCKYIAYLLRFLLLQRKLHGGAAGPLPFLFTRAAAHTGTENTERVTASECHFPTCISLDQDNMEKHFFQLYSSPGDRQLRDVSPWGGSSRSPCRWGPVRWPSGCVSTETPAAGSSVAAAVAGAPAAAASSRLSCSSRPPLPPPQRPCPPAWPPSCRALAPPSPCSSSPRSTGWGASLLKPCLPPSAPAGSNRSSFCCCHCCCCRRGCCCSSSAAACPSCSFPLAAVVAVEAAAAVAVSSSLPGPPPVPVPPASWPACPPACSSSCRCRCKLRPWRRRRRRRTRDRLREAPAAL